MGSEMCIRDSFESTSFGIKLIVREDFLALNYKEAYNEISAVIKKAVL